MRLTDVTSKDIPDRPGVYFFKKGTTVLYIGKATSLRSRTRSYFLDDVIKTRGPHIVDMVALADTIEWQETDTVLEALILEANLIKKFWPQYNTKEKDNKSFQYVVITDEALPQIRILRGRNLTIKNELEKIKPKNIFGPYPSGSALKEALKIIRKIFPYRDEYSSKKNNSEFYKQLGLSPETGTSELENSYKKNIANIILFLQGKKKSIIRSLTRDMRAYAKAREFEKAAHVKNQLFALGHINDVALIKDDSLRDPWSNRVRIEAYDVAHLSGKAMVGVMVVVVDGVPQKDEYRQFTIKSQKKSNDTGALREILVRRFKHNEWPLPDILLVDGASAQRNVALQVLDEYGLTIPVVALTKDEKHTPKKLQGEEGIVKAHATALTLANHEAHRFSIRLHTRKRDKEFIAKA